ncbi:MAG TPA: hypothetical protein VF594_07995, partial [Rubricoccaceae bacterium]
IEFVALGSDVEAGQVWVDERPVAAQALAQLVVPALWTGIQAAPGFDGQTVPYEADAEAAQGLRFVLEIGPGLHRIRVRYRVQAGSFDLGDNANRTWQVGYSLAPARLWAGFGQLDVAVLAPAGWDVAASLPLRDEPDAEGERLVGRFAGLPGDVLAVSTRAPEPAGRRLLHGLAFLTALVVAVVFGALGGIAVGRAGRRAAWALPVSLLGGVAAAAALVALRSMADGLGDSAALANHTLKVNVLLLGPAVLLLGTAVAQTVAARVARRVRRGPPDAPGPEIRN